MAAPSIFSADWRNELLRWLTAAFQPLSANLTSWAGVTRAAGFDTFVATPSSANLRSLLTDETGTGAAVFAGAPTITGVAVFSGIPSLTGGAITFPATQVASAGANDLDDYEEGIWTPGLTFGGGSTGMTFSFQTGRYTKIGRQVNVLGRFALTAKGSSTGNAVITGLPFTVTSAIQAAGSVARYTTLSGLTGAPVTWAELSTTTMPLFQTAAATVAALTDASFTNTSDIMFSCTYYV